MQYDKNVRCYPIVCLTACRADLRSQHAPRHLAALRDLLGQVPNDVLGSISLLVC